MKITKRRLKQIIAEELQEGGLAGHYTEPRHEGGTPEERLINKLLIRSKIERAGGDPQRAAEMLGLGDDEEVIAYLANLMGSPMLDNPNMAEARQLDPDLRLTDDQGPFVLRRSGAGQHEEYFRILQRRGQTLLPAWSAVEDAFKYQTADKAMDGKYRVEEHGNIPVQIIPKIEWSQEGLEEVRAPFPTGSRVKHEDYGEGEVTHAGTKNTNVAVLFDKKGRDGKRSRQVSRGSLKRA